MFIIGNLLRSIATLIDFVLSAYMWIVIIRALLTWVNPDPYNPIVRFLQEVTEPVLAKIRRYLPFLRGGGFDLSPMILILAILFLQQFLAPTLRGIAGYFG